MSESGRGPVLKYYAFRATSSAGFSIPIWVLFLQAQGLSYAEIYLLDAVWWVGIVGGEIPTGYVGDRLGWRNALVVGMGLRAVAVVAMGLSSSLGALAAVYLVWAVGSTLQSGSADAWLYETLDASLGTERFARVRGRGQSLALVVGAVGSVLGGYLGAVDLRWPFFLNGAVWGVATLVLLTLPAVDVDASADLAPRETLALLRDRLLAPSLRGVVLWAAVVLAVASAAARFTQPVTTDLGLATAHLGWLYAAFTLVAAGVSYRAEWLRDTVGLAGWLVLAPAALAVLMLASPLLPLVAFPAFVTVRVVRAGTRPLASQYVNDRVDAAGRATTLSGVSMVNSAVAVGFALSAGVLADRFSPLLAVGSLGGVLLAATVALAALGFDLAPADPDPGRAD